MSEASVAQAHVRSRRRGLAALAAAGTAGLMSLAGCGVQATGVRVVGAAPTLQAADAIGDSPGSGVNVYQLYFFRNGRLSAVERSTDQTVDDELVLKALIAGPNPTDLGEGYSTDIPQNLMLISNEALNEKWFYQYSQPLTQTEMAQIVCTVQADVGAPSVGTFIKGVPQLWHQCADFIPLGAPAALPTTPGEPSGVGVSTLPSQ